MTNTNFNAKYLYTSMARLIGTAHVARLARASQLVEIPAQSYWHAPLLAHGARANKKSNDFGHMHMARFSPLKGGCACQPTRQPPYQHCWTIGQPCARGGRNWCGPCRDARC